jgi:hypothetical protein
MGAGLETCPAVLRVAKALREGCNGQPADGAGVQQTTPRHLSRPQGVSFANRRDDVGTLHAGESRPKEGNGLLGHDNRR